METSQHIAIIELCAWIQQLGAITNDFHTQYIAKMSVSPQTRYFSGRRKKKHENESF